MVFVLYNLLLPVIFVVMLPYFLLRMCRRGGYAKGFMQRLGWYDAEILAQLKGRSRIWIHAVSVGETYVALRFMDEFRQVEPAASFVMSVNTSTAHTLARKSLPTGDVLIYFPVDFPVVIRRILRLVRPRMLILTECEFWPNLIRMSKAEGIPVMLINGRLSDKSFRGYFRYRGLFTPVLRMIDCLCLQGGRDRDRYLKLGVDPQRGHDVGNAKYDVALGEPGSLAKASAILGSAGMSSDDLILLGGSTWPGEEAVLLDFFIDARNRYPGLKLVLVPRHAERRDEVVAEIKRRGVSFAQRSKVMDSVPREDSDVLLVDTTGELKHLYTASSVVFVGKSLTQHGGQNVIEPAACGKAIVVGPNMENFVDIVRDFLTQDALIQVPSGQALIAALDKLLSDSEMRRVMGGRAASVVEKNRGSIQRTVALGKDIFSSLGRA